MSGSRDSRSRLYRITGTRFTEGVLAALRAYPSVHSVTRSSTSMDDLMLLEVTALDESFDVSMLVNAMIRAGGQIKTVERIV